MSTKTIQLHNIPPQPTPFIGREPEIEEIVDLLRDENCRLLTLLGAGGMGKTRLAIESVQRLSTDDFAHGVFYVPLAPLTSADNIVTTIIGVLGIMIGDEGTPQEELVKFLSGRNLLLVMDNFEHILEGTAIITDILRSTSHVKILVTSREVLNLSMEHVWDVQGMCYPDMDEQEDINQYDALNLFIERAVQIQRDFSPGDEQIAIIQICQLVDGLPLAIELAAGWLKTLSCRNIIKQIEHGIDFLSTRTRDIPERHRSMRAVFDHSWQLLTEDEQAVFPRLSVFRGGFTLEAAEAVADADLMTLSGLVEKSMVRRDDTGRYDLHNLLRQYANEAFITVGEHKQTQLKHMKWYVHFPEIHIDERGVCTDINSANMIKSEWANLRLAWLKLIQLDELDCPERYLFSFLHTQAWISGIEQFEQFLQHIQTSNHPNRELALGCVYSGLALLLLIVDQNASKDYAIRAIEIADQYPESVIAQWARHTMVYLYCNDKRFSDALKYVQFTRKKVKKYNLYEHWLLYTYVQETLVHRQAGDFDSAFKSARIALDMTPSTHLTFHHRLLEIAVIEFERRNYDRALQYLSRVDTDKSVRWSDQSAIGVLLKQFECYMAMNDSISAIKSVVNCLQSLKEYSSIQFQLEQLNNVIVTLHQHKMLNVERFIKVSATIYSHPDAFPNLRSIIDNSMQQVQSDDAFSSSFQTLWEQGEHNILKESIEELIEYFTVNNSDNLNRKSQPLAEPLTERELEVLALVADGLTNPQIADKLYLSVGTIKVHTRNIYGKLNVSNRTEAATKARDLKLI